MTDQPHSQGNPKQQQFSYIPAAALKRFADDLGNGEPNATKFLQTNRERIHQFIEKPSRPNSLLNSTEDRKTRPTVPGIHNYDLSTPSPSTFIHLQKQPEFQNSMGLRSRFGEGDGSFFDRWLNSDTVSSKHLYDKDGFPIMK
jgi:hypothetical protein